MSELERRTTENGDIVPRSLVGVILASITAVFVFGLMALTFGDVLGRYVFSAPVPGGVEILEILLVLSVFAALPLAAANREHVTVGIFERFFRGSWRRWQRLAVLVITVIMAAFVAAEMWSQAEILRIGNSKTMSLRLPIYPVVYLVAFFALIAFAYAARDLIQFLRGRDPIPPDHADTEH